MASLVLLGLAPLLGGPVLLGIAALLHSPRSLQEFFDRRRGALGDPARVAAAERRPAAR